MNFNFEELYKAEVVPMVESINTSMSENNYFPTSDPKSRINGDKNIACEGFTDVYVWTKTEISNAAAWERVSSQFFGTPVRFLENYYVGNTALLVFAVNSKQGTAKSYIRMNNELTKLHPKNGFMAAIYHAKVAQRLYGLPERFWEYPASIPDCDIYGELKKAFRQEKKKR
jgi:hypothetical protein